MIAMKAVARRAAIECCAAGRRLGTSLFGSCATALPQGPCLLFKEQNGPDTFNTLERSYYHTTSISCALTRRRKRGGRDNAPSSAPPKKQTADDEDEEDEADKHVRNMDKVVKDWEEFQPAAIALLDKLHKAMLPLAKINNNMLVTRDAGNEQGEDLGDDEDTDDVIYGEHLLIDLGAMEGQYTLQIDKEQRNVVFQSPLSGVHYYHLTCSGDFLSVTDGHNLEGILVRDLIRQIKGVPRL